MNIESTNSIPTGNNEIQIDGKGESKKLRRSPRLATNQTFRNIYGVENEGSEDSPPPVVVKFDRSQAQTINFNEEMENGNLTYAPSLREPYYMAIHKSQFTQLFGNTPTMARWATETKETGFHLPRANPDVALSSFFNVSLKLFYDMARDQVDWLSLSCLEDPRITAQTKIDKNEVNVLKEMAFGQLMNPPNRDPVDGASYVEPPPTDTDAKPTMAIEEEPLPNLDVQEQELQDIINNTPDAGPLEWEAEKEKINKEIADDGFRRAYVPIRHPKGWLIWVRLPNWKKTRQGRRKQLNKLKNAFKTIWMYSTATDPESAAGCRPRYSSADLGFPLYVVPSLHNLSARLSLLTDEADTLFQTAVREINLGKSQQHTELIVLRESEVREPEYYKMSENPFGFFTTYISADALDTYMKSLEVLHGHAALNPIPNNASRNSINYAAVFDALGDYVKSKKPMSRSEYTDPQEAAVKSMTSNDQRAKLQTYFRDQNGDYSWRVDITSDKISDACGKRNGKFAPSAIMGMSANNVAVDALGWNPLDKAQQILGRAHRIANGLYMAEWLHLCAFSWGGLTRLETKGEALYRSSDIPGNLIIGTSETNSVMTRFEKAWQGLVVDESVENNGFYAELIVTRNPHGELVKRDLKTTTTGHYVYGSSVMTKEESEIANHYHFMAYTVSYSIKFPQGSKLLKMQPGSSLKTTFYPFLRPLYHSLEDQLDQVLYGKMCVASKNSSVLLNIARMSLSYGPYTTDGKVANDGTVATGDKKGFGANGYTQSLNSLHNGTASYTKKGKIKKGQGNKPYITTNMADNEDKYVIKKVKDQGN